MPGMAEQYAEDPEIFSRRRLRFSPLGFTDLVSLRQALNIPQNLDALSNQLEPLPYNRHPSPPINYPSGAFEFRPRPPNTPRDDLVLGMDRLQGIVDFLRDKEYR